MPDTKTRSKKRAPKEFDPATFSASASKKVSKRTPAEQAVTAEATRRNEANVAAKKTSKEKKAKNRSLSPDCDEVIARVLDKARSEIFGPPSAERTPTIARNLCNDWRSESVQSDNSSPKNLSATTGQRAEPKEAQEVRDDTAPFAKEERERQRLIFILDSSAPASSDVFSKNTATERTAAAKEVAARNERECTGRGKFLARRIAEANDLEID